MPHRVRRTIAPRPGPSDSRDPAGPGAMSRLAQRPRSGPGLDTTPGTANITDRTARTQNAGHSIRSKTPCAKSPARQRGHRPQSVANPGHHPKGAAADHRVMTRAVARPGPAGPGHYAPIPEAGESSFVALPQPFAGRVGRRVPTPAGYHPGSARGGLTAVVRHVLAVPSDERGVVDDMERPELGLRDVDHVRSVVRCAVLGKPPVSIFEALTVVGVNVAVRAEVKLVPRELLAVRDRVLALAALLGAGNALQTVRIDRGDSQASLENDEPSAVHASSPPAHGVGAQRRQRRYFRPPFGPVCRASHTRVSSMVMIAQPLSVFVAACSNSKSASVPA